jgi:hypothetical protein
MTHSGTQWRTVLTLRKGHTVVVGVGNEKEKKSDHGRIAHKPHGGKTGMAMVKYPGYKKNAQRKYYPRIPRFDNRVV